MSIHVNKTQDNKSQTPANETPQLQNDGVAASQFEDKRPETLQLAKLQGMANTSKQVRNVSQWQAIANNQHINSAGPPQITTDNSSFQAPAIQNNTNSESIQLKNNTGLPDQLKTGMENLSGMSLDDVKVHRNSDKPAQLNAHAYAQGTNIHLGPGQEKHLPHEAWHVVQQKQGRVKPTLQMKAKVNVNDNPDLEKEADVMGAKALQVKVNSQEVIAQRKPLIQPDWHVPKRQIGESQPLQLKNDISINNDSIREQTSGNQIMQFKPIDLKKAKYKLLLGLPRGWFFDPWKRVKRDFNRYADLHNMPLDPRRTGLAQTRVSIEKWEAHPRNKALAKANNKIKIISAAIPYLKQYIENEFTEIAGIQDHQDGQAPGIGHAHTRHGADLTDDQLEERLTTGFDRGGGDSKAPASSRFSSFDLMAETRNDVSNLLNAAKTATAADFAIPLTNYQAAWTAFIPLWAAWLLIPAGPGKAGGPPPKANINAAWNAIKAVRNGIGNPSPNRLPVKLNQIKKATIANLPNKIENSVTTFNGYATTKNHGKVLGSGFKGKGKKIMMGGGNYKYAATVPIAAAKLPKATLTALRPGQISILKVPPAAAWAQVTHYPKDAGAVAVAKINGQ